MRKNDLSVFKLEQEGFKITLKRGIDDQPVISAMSSPALPMALPAPEVPVNTSDLSESRLRDITSPMVGTFYAAASPESPAYVTIGQEVTEDTVVCIIEAMKVMNEIKSEIRGTVVEIVAESGKPVQFGQPLFRVK